MGLKFDIFNSSSFCANMLVTLMNSWRPFIKSKKVLQIWELSYKIIKKRIINRITCVDCYTIDTELYVKHPLRPYKTSIEKSHIRRREHLKRKLENVESFDMTAIARSPVSTHEIYTKHYRNPRSVALYPYRSVRWDTLSPRKVVNPPFVKKWSLNIPANDNPLLPKVYSETGLWVPVNQKVVKTRRKWVPLSEYIKTKEKVIT